jgi:hypothetical protein
VTEWLVLLLRIQEVQDSIPDQRSTILEVFIVVLNPFRKILGWHIKISCDHFVRNSSYITIPNLKLSLRLDAMKCSLAINSVTMKFISNVSDNVSASIIEVDDGGKDSHRP